MGKLDFTRALFKHLEGECPSSEVVMYKGLAGGYGSCVVVRQPRPDRKLQGTDVTLTMDMTKGRVRGQVDYTTDWPIGLLFKGRASPVHMNAHLDRFFELCDPQCFDRIVGWLGE